MSLHRVMVESKLCNLSALHTVLNTQYHLKPEASKTSQTGGKLSLFIRCTNEVVMASRMNNMVIHLKSLRICCWRRLQPPMLFQPGGPEELWRGDIQNRLGESTPYPCWYCMSLWCWHRWSQWIIRTESGFEILYSSCGRIVRPVGFFYPLLWSPIFYSFMGFLKEHSSITF